jgi:hypothetical protein
MYTKCHEVHNNIFKNIKLLDVSDLIGTSSESTIIFIVQYYTGSFISPSGNSDPCGTVAGMVTQKGNISTEGETLQFSVPPYRFSICAPLVTRQMSIL